MKLTIGHLYPDLLNLYGDRGNIQCMMKRSQWRGIEAETIEFTLEDTIDFSNLDIVLLGGGSDREQMIVCSQLRSIQKDFKEYVEDGGTVLAVCGGYQLLGHYYKTEEGTIEGLSLVDLYTEQGSPRLIDNIVLENKDFSLPIVGFENHGGRTYIGENRPFGKVLYGHGNNVQKCSGNLSPRSSPSQESPYLRLSAFQRIEAEVRRRQPGAAGRFSGKRSQPVYLPSFCKTGLVL